MDTQMIIIMIILIIVINIDINILARRKPRSKKPRSKNWWIFHVPRKPRVNQSPIGLAMWRNLAIQENVSATIVVQTIVCNVLCPPRWPATWPCAVLPNPHAGEATHYPQHNFWPRTCAGEHIYIYIYIHTHIHTYIHTYTHIHTQYISLSLYIYIERERER